ncbi:MAG: 4Fe-4S binding protein [Gemmatimonadota bacterium]
MKRSVASLCVGGLVWIGVGWLSPPDLAAQRFRDIPPTLLFEVLPSAQRFSERSGDPPVFRAYATGVDGQEQLIGYVFHTADLPPERTGYSGPIETLVGMDLQGRLTGVRITDYWESLRSSQGDFLRVAGVQEQYVGKHIGDAFSVGDDVDGVSRATISALALARGVRDAARRVAEAYLSLERAAPDETTEAFETLSWLELGRRGLVERMALEGAGRSAAQVSLVFLENDRFGELLVGERAMEMVRRARDADPGAPIVLYGIDGPDVRLFQREGWQVVQGADTLALESERIRPFGLASGGMLDTQLVTSGLMLLPPAVDATRPFTVRYQPTATLGPFTAEIRTQAARLANTARLAAGSPEVTEAGSPEAPPAEPPAELSKPETLTEADSEPAESAPVADTAAVPLRSASGSPSAATSETVEIEPPATGQPALDLPLREFQDETRFARALARASGGRLLGIVTVLLLATLAFFSKRPAARWTSLAATLGYLGFIDGGFLSISHLTSAIWVGPGTFLDDLPLLLLVTFTLVSTLVWGRVFCGFLCPFGALQDLLERILPSRWQRSLPRPVHRLAVWAKYGVLALIVGSALSGSHRSLYAWFEPFGTVFFGTRSFALIGIAGALVLAAVVVPRFYCRYACPLGAALAVGSLVAFRRIPRVRQCTVCSVCEQRCPTGAIEKAAIDFKECVRCNVCETLLHTKTGVCRHDWASVEPRLVQIQAGDRRGAAHVR